MYVAYALQHTLCTVDNVLQLWVGCSPKLVYIETVAAGPPWGSARELSLSAHMAGGPPPLLAPGRVTSPRQLIGVWPVLLGRRCCVERVVFNHLRESLNPFIHTGPRRGRSFRRRLRQWCRWHGTWNVEAASHVYVRRRL
jgi:hypothetical protein